MCDLGTDFLWIEGG